MKFFISALWLSLSAFFFQTDFKTQTLTGTVRNAQTGDTLPGASVRILRHYAEVGRALSDDKGQYKVAVEPGRYDLECSLAGYVTKRITNVPVESGKDSPLDLLLSPGAVLDETSAVDFETYQRLSVADPTPASMKEKEEMVYSEYAASPVKEVVMEDAVPVDEIKAMPTTPVSKIEAVPARMPVDAGDVAIKGSRSSEKDYYIDGVRVTSAPVKAPSGVKGGEAPRSAPEETTLSEVVVTRAGKAKAKASEKPAMLRDKADAKWDPMVKRSKKEAEREDKEISAPGGAPEQPAPHAGLLTAGEWNDLNNWNRHWTDLLNDGEIAPYQKMYAFYPKHRYTVLLTNEQDFPIADAAVTLLSASGETLWESRSDNTGKAELWAGLFADQSVPERVSAKVSLNGSRAAQDLGTLKPFKEGINRRKIAAACNAPQNVDIVWAVDATGSMGDEIEYLKTELLDVIGRAKSLNPALSFRMGTVFYRDKDDEYLTQSSGLSYEIGKTVDFIRKQFAGGGGDYPEAVESALDEAVYNQRWSEHAIARICFLVLDASPHESPEVNERLQRSIREAARRGIRVVPVAASGIQKDTEFLMKFFGLATNGTYVFLTDHSGIGGKHIEATTDEYKVEPLNALLVRLLTEYTAIETCEGKSAIRFEDPQQPGHDWQALYYPNPAFGQFTLDLPVDVQSMTLYDAEGKAVKKVDNLAAGTHSIPLGSISDGVYTLRIHKDNQWQSGKLVVVGK